MKLHRRPKERHFGYALWDDRRVRRPDWDSYRG